MRNNSQPSRGKRDLEDESVEAATAAAAGAMAGSDTIDQVRELLFGADKRNTEATLAELKADLQRSVEELRRELQHQVDVLTNRLIELERDTENRRISAIADIGAAIGEIGARVQNLGAQATRR